MYLLGRPCGFTIIPSAIFCASRRFRFKNSFICSFSNPNASAISRFVFPASFISRISFSKSLMCVYFLLDIMTPLDVLLLSYIKGCFVYCPFLLVQFRQAGVPYFVLLRLCRQPRQSATVRTRSATAAKSLIKSSVLYSTIGQEWLGTQVDPTMCRSHRPSA